MDIRLLLRRWLEIVGVCFLLVGCQHNPWADRFLKVEPEGRDLVGTYRVDSDTLARRISIPMSRNPLPINRDSEIVLSADHSAQFLRVPEVREPTQQVCVVDGTGSWSIGRNDAYYVVNVQIQRKGAANGCGPNYYGQLMVYGKKLPYRLHITIGDPDSGDAMQFERLN